MSQTEPDNGWSEMLAGCKRTLARPLADYYLVLAAAAALIGLGLFMVVSASSVISMVEEGSPYAVGLTQIRNALIGLPMIWLFSRMPQRLGILLGWGALAVALVTLTLVILPGTGGMSHADHTAWLSIGPVSMQPSEFAKPALALWSAALFSQPARFRQLDQTKPLLIPYLPIAAIVLGLVLAERDLGTALVVGLIIVLQLWHVGAPGKIMAAVIVPVIAAAAGLVALSDVHRVRVHDFVANLFPSLGWSLQSGSDQPQNAIYALATGGWWGSGLGASRQKWGGLYDGAHNDYILAVMGEELGLFGILLVLGLMFTVIHTAFKIARRSTSPFWRLTASGVAGWLLVQTTINTLMAFGWLPVIGVPFPLVSYGGSALWAGFIGIGLLLAAARHEPAAQEAIEAARQRRRERRRTGLVVAKRGRTK